MRTSDLLIKIGPCQWVPLPEYARSQMIELIMDMIRELRGEQNAARTKQV